MMKHTFINLLFLIKNAIKTKQKIIIIKYTNQNQKFLSFLLENNFISGFEKKKEKGHSFLLVFLKYDFSYKSVLQDFSIVSRFSKPQLRQKLVKKQNINYIVNLSSPKINFRKNRAIKLLAKFR